MSNILVCKNLFPPIMKQQINPIHSVEVQNFRSDPSSGKWACQACTYYNYPKVWLNLLIVILIIIAIVTIIIIAVVTILILIITIVIVIIITIIILIAAMPVLLIIWSTQALRCTQCLIMIITIFVILIITIVILIIIIMTIGHL